MHQPILIPLARGRRQADFASTVFAPQLSLNIDIPLPG